MASTMFVDIKGFTPLTEKLLLFGTEGAEVLSEILDEIFSPMVAIVAEKKGIIPHFAGDAFTAIFIDDKGEAVLDVAWRIKQHFDNKELFSTPFGDFDINVRIGLSYGVVEWGLADEKSHAYYFKGAAIERATLAQQQAQSGQIVFDKWLGESIKTLNIEALDSDSEFAVLNAYHKHPLSIEHENERLSSMFHENIPFIQTTQPTIYSTKGEFREVIAVFISFTNALEFRELEAIAKIVLTEFKNFGGYFKEIDFSEKNGVIVGIFGAPISYENNAHRALECVLAIKDNINHLHTKHPFRIRVGMTEGVAFTGMIGSNLRSQYAAVGDKVNLAARLMQNAQWGEILTDKSLSHLKSFEFIKKGTLLYKGISSEVETFQLIKKNLEEKPFFTGSMVGRNAELDKLCAFSSKMIEAQKGGVAFINGEAGIGKSRLTYELRQNIEKKMSVNWAICPVDQILKKPFNPFIYFLKQYFKQVSNDQSSENIHNFKEVFNHLLAQLQNNLEKSLDVELARTESILSALVGLNYEDSLWEQLDAKGRYENTLAALENFFITLSQFQPLVLEIEDAHWLDSDSIIFLNNFIKKIPKYPIFILFTSRYDDEGNKIIFLEKDLLKNNHIRYIEIDLTSFSKTDLRVFTENKLRGRVHPELLKTLWSTSNGNPFYVEQILDYFIENDLLEPVEEVNTLGKASESGKEWNIVDKKIKISNSITGIMTARVDRLSYILKETVKTAAVIGREFELPILSEVMLTHEEYISRNGNGKIVLQEQIQNAEKGQIWQAMNELRYIFRHSLLREAIYDMQLKTRVRELHAMIAQAIEKIHSKQLEDRYIDLAFHYEHAQNIPKTNEYLKKAGDYAKRNFQNQNALDLYDRLLKNLKEGTERIKVLIKKGEILQLIGDWNQSENCYKEALNIAKSFNDVLLKGRAQNALGQVLMLKGNYITAKEHFEKSAVYFEQLTDIQGITKSYGNLGNLYFRQGEYEKAKDYYTKSIKMNRENNKFKNTQIVSHLGLTYMNQGNYTEGVRCQEEELQICESQNDLNGMSILYINMGIILSEKGDNDRALSYLEKGLDLAQKLGNKQSVAIALGCLGNLWLQKSDFEKAREYFVQDVKMTEELGDKQGIAIACELQGRWHSAKGEFEEGIVYFTKSIAICRELNYQKGVAKALQGLGEIHAFNCDYLDALSCIEEAILIAQKIKNLSILCYCLTDKGNILLKLGDYMGAKVLQNELKASINFSENQKLFDYCRYFLNKI